MEDYFDHFILNSFIMEDPNESSRHRYFKQNLLDVVYKHISRVNVASRGGSLF